MPTFEQHLWFFEYLQTQEAFNQPGVDIERQSVGALLTDEDLYDHLRNLGAKWCLDRKGWFLFGRHMAFGGIEPVLCKEEQEFNCVRGLRGLRLPGVPRLFGNHI